MTRVFRRISSMPTAVGSAFLALSGLAVIGCGGKGDRQQPNVTVSQAEQVDPCNLSETLEVSQFGCTPGEVVHAAGSSYISRCLDWDGTLDANGDPIGGAPSGGFVYTDSIAGSAANYDVHVQPYVEPGLLTQVKMPTDGAHCSEHKDLYAFHLVTAFEDIWGPQFGVKFTAQSDGPLPPVDVTPWEGFAFWIKKGTTYPANYPASELNEPTGSSLFVSLGDVNSTSSPSDDIPPCNDTSNHDYLKCDPFGKAIGFDTDWRFIMIRFEDLKQRGYGVPSPPLILDSINQIKFSMDIGDGANGNWNVWVDDVILYRHKTADAGTP